MSITITTNPEELSEGLFGQVFLHVFEILPYLEQNQLKPRWNIRSLKYGTAPEYTIIPGLLDLNYEAMDSVEPQERTLADLRLEHVATLGGDWHYAHRLWNKYFTIPSRVVARADSFGPLGTALGLHYRGTDKNTDLSHTNPVSQKDFLTLVDDFLANHPDVNTLFIATDENEFLDCAKSRYPSFAIIDTGKVDFWKDVSGSANVRKGDHALLDCLLLSRCRYLMKCQSALSGFAKVLNPDLNAYRIAASKTFFYDIPYFPDAYIERYASTNPSCSRILQQLFKDDWQDNPESVSKYGKVFGSCLRSEAMRNMPPSPTDLQNPTYYSKLREGVRKLMIR